MICTAHNCNSILRPFGNKNSEDYGCFNRRCPANIEVNYTSRIIVRDNWWFSPNYHLPFRLNDKWYSALGPHNSQGLKTIFHQLAYIGLKDVLVIPYFALPVNEDFNPQFNILVSMFEKYMLLK